MLLTSLLGGQELASQLLNKGCRGDSEALLCWTHPKSWPRVDLGGQDRRRGGKLQGGLLLCTDLPSTAPSPAGRCWSRPAWPGGTGSGSQDCPHLEIAMKTWRLRWDESLPMTTTSASDGTSLPRFSEVKLKARLFVRVCLCCKIVRQQNLRWSVKFCFFRLSKRYGGEMLWYPTRGLRALIRGATYLLLSTVIMTKIDKNCQKMPKTRRCWEGAGCWCSKPRWKLRSSVAALLLITDRPRSLSATKPPLSAQNCLKPGLEKGQKIHKTQNIPCS